MEYTPQLYLSVPQAAVEMHTEPRRLRELASREVDPFPITVPPWRRSHGLVCVRDMMDWYDRNAGKYR